MQDSADYLNSYLQDNYNETEYHRLLKYPEEDLAKSIAATDFSFFCKYYLPHYFNKPWSPMHRELIRDIQPMPFMEHGDKIARASPRESAKSTLTVTGQILWRTCNNYGNYIQLIKDTGPQSELDLGGIREELEDNDLIHRDYGNLVGKDKWGRSEILTSNGILIQSLGAGMKIRGRKYRQHRPDLIILDDIENEENTNTPDQRKKLYDWLTRAVLKAGSTKTVYFFIGTILHYDSLLSNILVNPGWKAKKYRAVIDWADDKRLWDQWKTIYVNIDDIDHKDNARAFYTKNKDAMLEGSKVLWGEMHDYYFYQTKIIDEGRESFDSEYQNDPISLDDALFKVFNFYSVEERPTGLDDSYEYWLVPPRQTDEIRTTLGFDPVRLMDCTLYGSCDPSLGKTQKSDFSAIIIGALTPKNRLFVLDADIQRRPPNIIMDDIFKLVLKYKNLGMDFEQFAVESVAFQEFFKDQVAEKSMERGLFLPVTETKTATRNKEARIQTLQPDITNGYIMLNKNHDKLINQLRYFPKAAHDDGPDALEMLRDISRGGKGFVMEPLDLEWL